MEKTQPININQEVESSYLDYAMSVIVARALPDVRDGLKPVQRRILYAMWRLGLKQGAKYSKSAKVVGEVLGKFHPHGDSSVYDALARMAQNFSLRYPLIQGQGNWGSIDGDPPAAMRYTEARLAKLSEELLEDIDKETVNWKENFDGSQKEPEFLPARIPHLLLNGAQGIAVGMATNIPPHNLTELCDALLLLLNKPDATLDELATIVKGPDFPTGAIIYDSKAIKEAYGTGRGAVPMRARVEIKEDKKKQFIVVSELPYQTNKSDLISHIAELVRDGKIEGIQDIIDGSREGKIHIVIDLKKSAHAEKVVNQLYVHTQLQKNFNILMIALVDGIEPRVLSLPEMLTYYLAHHKEVLRRKITYLLEQAKARLHILDGLVIALDNIDAVISLIRKSENKQVAKEKLQKQFSLSQIQAEAILQMRLQELAKLERDTIVNEQKEKRALVKEYEAILGNEKRLIAEVKKEIVTVKEKYGDKRKTEVKARSLNKFDASDLVPKESTLLTLTKNGYVKRIAPKTYQAQGRGGVGIIGMGLQEGDAVFRIASASTHDTVLFFGADGRLFTTKAYQISEKGRTAKGDGLYELFQNSSTIYDMSVLEEGIDQKNHFLVVMSRMGLIKKVALEVVLKSKRNGIKIMNVKDNDECIGGFIVGQKQEILVATRNGQALRFNLSEVRPMGRAAAGVRGFRLKGDDTIASMVRIDNAQGQLLVVNEKGFGKRTKVSAFSPHHRGGSGIKISNVTTKTGKVRTVVFIEEGAKEVILYTRQGKTLKTSLTSIPLLGRMTQGVKIIRLKAGDGVASALLV